MTPTQELNSYLVRKNPQTVAVLIDSITNHRTTAVEDLTNSEIGTLLQIFRPKTIEEKANALVDEAIMKQWRSNIIALAERTGIKKLGQWSEFNNWMLLSSVFKKHLNAHSLEELKALYQQLRGVERNNERSASKTMTKAWWKKAEDNKAWN
ncbi:hypothetical protein [Epilithonimonas arachidiradicis]|uniref:Uncharacterized protein n=1 Tax=Epilithonimonas arachidiradicis TaxID=1617282 RepID=A0A420DDN7_9FLAO|nr:hypothetical protein [Epilithonimonas arachidiradicis]RKE90035.1 hypothetical protein BXY58_0620 [Epilithonimonas arachidiradicis]GGG47225.1 hypothetical protein GCM10007332_05920 [Epilithonimonas arachidiradicis]